MGLHGVGIFGCSSANQKGAKRHQCPKCGQWWVEGSHNGHNLGGCPLACPECGKLNWGKKLIGQCPDCGYDLLGEKKQ